MALNVVMLALRLRADPRWPLGGLAAASLTAFAVSFSGFSARPLAAVIGSDVGLIAYLSGAVGAFTALAAGLVLSRALTRLDRRATLVALGVYVLTVWAIAFAPLLSLFTLPLTVAAPPLARR